MNHFNEKLAYSLRTGEKMDLEILKNSIVGCVEVVKTPPEMDRAQHVDYVATLRGGGKILIDAKTREPGAKKYWRSGPELVLEKWSVVPSERHRGKAGWTLLESTPVDMILYTFDPEDCNKFYLIPYHHLRMAFIHNADSWGKRFRWLRQKNEGYYSEAMFVPADIVLGAVMKEMSGDVA